MSEEFTETTKISYWGNIKNSLSGLIFGIVLFLASFVVLWMNEGHNVTQLATASFVDKTAIEISAEKADRANDGKLIQVSGNATTDTTLTDKIISVPNTFVLKRNVEMYQWEEDIKTDTKDEMGGSTTETKTYSYEKVWSSHEIDSSNFKKQSYVNPPFTIKSETYYAEKGKLGDFKLTTKQTHAMNDYSGYEDLPQKAEYKIYNNMYYKGLDPENPRIGDVRISYEVVPSGTDISIIGQQRPNNTITSMRHKDNMVYIQQSGDKTKDEMVYTFEKNNKFFTNLVRILGWFMMFIGLNMVISPLVVIFKVVPFVESIVGGLSKGVIFLITLALSLLTIAIAWFAYRPTLSIILLLVIGGIFFALKGKFKSAKENN